MIPDINMEGRSGPRSAGKSRRRAPNPVLILSMYPVAEFAVRALKQRGRWLFEQAECAGELVNAVQTVLTGRRYISAALADRLADDLVRDSTKPCTKNFPRASIR